jgi:hypothetical protein
MSEMSEKARAEGKEKVKRLTSGGKDAVDASGWTEDEYGSGLMHTEKKLGNRPISKQNLATGGKAAHRHAGRKSRDMGGPMSSAGQNYVAQVPAPPQNRFAFSGNQSPFLAAAGMKKGGEAKHWIAGAVKHPGALHKELGVPEGKDIPEKKLKKAEHSDNPTERKRADLAVTLKGMKKRADGGQAEEIEGKRPKGGRYARKDGGSAGKGKMNVNIIIAQKPEHQMMPGGAPGGAMPPPKPQMPMPVPGAPAPMGSPQGAPAGPMPGGPNMPPPSMQPPMGRKDGGKVYPDMQYAAAGGKGRLEKAKKYGL